MVEDYKAVSISPPAIPQRSGLGVVSLVLGLISIPLSLVAVGLLFGIVGIFLGVLHFGRSRIGRGVAAAGIAASTVGVLVGAYIAQLVPSLSDFVVEAFVQGPAKSRGDLGERFQRKWEGVRAPDFTGTTLEGETVSLSDFRGKKVFIQPVDLSRESGHNFARMDQMRAEFSAEELVILMLSDETESMARSLASEYELNYPVVVVENLPDPYTSEGLGVIYVIDRQGIVQRVWSSGRNMAEWREIMTSSDYEDIPLDEPAMPRDDLVPSANPMVAEERWSLKVDGAKSLCTGDWNGDGIDEILVSDGVPQLFVFDQQGTELERLPLPCEFSDMGLGVHADGVRLFGISFEDDGVCEFAVLDQTGQLLWRYDAWIGVQDAYWIDVNADGNDEIVLSTYGGGLVLLTPEGKIIWRKAFIVRKCNGAARSQDGTVRLLGTGQEGQLYIFDKDGRKISVLAPEDEYYLNASIAVADAANGIQYIGRGIDRVLAFNEVGEVLWSTPANHGFLRECFLSVNVNGDGINDWVLYGPQGTFQVVSSEGERLAELFEISDVWDLAFADPMLISLSEDRATVTAYHFVPQYVESSPGTSPAPPVSSEN